MNCPSCGSVIPDGSAFCPSCGHQVPQQGAVCPGCGAPVKLGTKFCGVCGRPLSATGATASPSMPAVCPQCGAPLPAGASFCPSCGHRFGAGSAGAAGAMGSTCPQCGSPLPSGASACPTCGYVVKQKKAANYKAIGIGAVAVVAVVVLAAVGIFFIFFRGNNPEDVVKDYLEFCLNEDMGYDSMPFMDPAYVNAVMDEANYDDEDMRDWIEENRENSFDTMADLYGKGWTYEYEIVDEDPYRDSELEDVEDFYDDAEADVPDVSEGREYEVEVTVVDKDGDDEEERTMTIGVVKSNGHWYLDPMRYSLYL